MLQQNEHVRWSAMDRALTEMIVIENVEEDLSGEDEDLMTFEFVLPPLTIPVIDAHVTVIDADAQIGVRSNVRALLINQLNFEQRRMR